jgi:isoleucyl-tRNA synthetase
LAAGRSSGASTSVEVDGAPVSIGPDDVIATQVPRSGWAVASGGGETVALEIAITPELRREGLAREVIRRVQDARKNDGLDVTDRISLRWSTADADLSAALTEHGAMISTEVLAVDYGPQRGDGTDPSAREHVEADLGLVFWIRRIDPAE